MSFVTQLLCEDDDPVDMPDLAQVESAVSKLDGNKCTMVVLRGDGPDVNLSIGGGSGGLYVVSLTYDNRRFLTLLNPTAQTGRISMVCGGQRGEFDAKKCAVRSVMLQAVRTFAATGERDVTLHWSRW